MEPGFLVSMMELNEEVAEMGEDEEDVKKFGRLKVEKISECGFLH